MTLHWWQHWFWITGRAPVVGLLLAACHVWCQQPPWGHPGQPGGADLGDALPHWWLPAQGAVAPVALHVPVDAPPPAWYPYPWAPRRLLGFAAIGDVTANPMAESTAAAAPVAVSYLTTLGPGPGRGAAPASSSQPTASAAAPGAREAKAIGVLPVGVQPTLIRAVPTIATTATRPPSTATSVLEIVEDLASAATPSPSSSESAATSAASEPPSPSPSAENEAGVLASSAEMPSDEPAKTASASSAEASPTEASEPSPSPASSTAPTRMQSLSLSTAAAVDVTAASANDSHVSAGSTAPPSTPSSTSPALLPAPAVAAHPAVSGPRRVATTPAPAAAAAAATPTWTSEGPAAATASPQPPHSHRSAAAPLGSSSAGPSGGSRQHHVDAMSLSSGGGLDAGSITGIVLGIVVFAGLVGTVSFILYRRRYLNKPQTLNDKCSNPDSSGYIDDSTFRENSEEMYSLDNDSFLNSLEAMTIQNYWTDTVKHTKL